MLVILFMNVIAPLIDYPLVHANVSAGCAAVPNSDSTRYTIGFAAVVCVVCALVVAASAVGLRSRQEANALAVPAAERAAGGRPGEAGATSCPTREFQQLFDRDIEARVIDLATGEYWTNGKIDAADLRPAQCAQRPGADRAGAAECREGRAAADLRRASSYVGDGTGDDGASRSCCRSRATGSGARSTASSPSTATARRPRPHFLRPEGNPGPGRRDRQPALEGAVVGPPGVRRNWEPRITVIKGNAGPPPRTAPRRWALGGHDHQPRGDEAVAFWLSDDGFGPYLERFRAEGRG